MAMWLKQSTAVTIRIGPFLDKTDGVTEETGAIAATAVQVAKGSAGAFGNKSDATAPVHDQNGWYSCVLNTTDTGTLGLLIVKIDDAATFLPVWHEFMVLPANVYDALVAGTDKLQIDQTQYLGAASPALVGGRLDASVGAMAANVLNAAAIATAAFTASKFAAGAIDAAAFAQAAADKVWSSTTRTLSAFSTALALSVWDVLETAIVTASTIGVKVKTNLYAVLTARTLAAAAYFDPAVDTVANVTTAGTVTDGAKASVATEARLAELDAANLPTDVAATATPAQVNAEVLDVVNVDTLTLPGQAAPTNTPTMREVLGWVYKAFRNKKEQTATGWSLYDDAGTTVDSKATIADAAGTASKAEIVSGP